jgi:glyoxylase-like metal-dependent hydrolase (beta-lactamase superfamily II)
MLNNLLAKVIFTIALSIFAIASEAKEASILQSVKVTDNIFALVGPLDQRNAENAGDNATFGVILTPKGVILIDSGASKAGAQLIQDAIHKLTKQPVRWVINTGSQDHRWLGNASFAAKGAKIIALQSTVDAQKSNAAHEIQVLNSLLGETFAGTEAMSSPAPLSGDSAKLNQGGTELELLHLGNGHFPGDAVVWLPKQQIAFSGDLVFVDRLLGVLDNGSRVDQWAQTFKIFATRLKPKIIVPGHGRPCSLAQAQAETGDYLNWLVQEVKPAAENLEPIEVVVKRVHETAPLPIRKLHNFDTIDKVNINHAYLEFQ